jgi:hypothetical protein
MGRKPLFACLFVSLGLAWVQSGEEGRDALICCTYTHDALPGRRWGTLHWRQEQDMAHTGLGGLGLDGWEDGWVGGTNGGVGWVGITGVPPR